MYTYSIMPLREEHFEEVCEDIRDQFNRGISSCPMFNMTLVPEGNPVWDKVTPMCALYRRYHDALAPEGIKTGVLVQACMGHAYTLTPNPFQRYVNINDGKEEFICCPEDEAFVEHFCGVLKQIAAEHPDAIMLDDDFRMAVRPGRGCACPRHMAEFNRRAGLNMTREELYEHIMSHPEDDPLTRLFLDLQTESLIKTVKKFREAIDSVDPTIQGINCTSGDNCDSVIYTNKIFAGKGNPTIVRCANGTYAPITVRRFSETMRNGAVRSSRLKKNGIDIVLSETDTVPHNRYAKNARYLHAHYTASILEGLKGSKHWLTRSQSYEPKSGRAFRDILADHRYFYERLAELSDEIRWVGCGSVFTEQKYPTFHMENFRFYHENEWTASVLERMGLPFYFAEVPNGAAFLEADIISKMDREQIEAIFENNSVFVDGFAAKQLCELGYGELLGVKVSEWDLGNVKGETFDGTRRHYCTAQKNKKKIEVVNDAVKVMSHNFAVNDGKCILLAPAVTCFERDGGRLSVVYCGSPKAAFKYTEGFAFLNESRKTQFIELLKAAKALPVYYEGDNEICFRAGHLADGRLLVGVFDIGFDPMDELTLYLESAPTEIRRMLPDGRDEAVEFEALGENIYSLKTRVEPMYPVILLIK